VSAEQVKHVVERAVPGHKVLAVEALSGGLSNEMYRVTAAGLDAPLVLRFYLRDGNACRKEVELHERIGGRVPVAGIVYANFSGAGGVPPHVAMRWIEGVSFREIKRRGDASEVAECARAIGAVLARIGEFTFERAGEIGPGLAVRAPLVEGVAAFIENCAASAAFERRVEKGERERLREYVRRWEPELAAVERERSLVHSDFGSPNLLMRCESGVWRVAAVLDWEFAYGGRRWRMWGT
jgi:aminoglycoside phosphotransferase (APT) family kinase protein